jgi:hypothetical protein
MSAAFVWSVRERDDIEGHATSQPRPGRDVFAACGRASVAALQTSPSRRTPDDLAQDVLRAPPRASRALSSRATRREIAAPPAHEHGHQHRPPGRSRRAASRPRPGGAPARAARAAARRLRARRARPPRARRRARRAARRGARQPGGDRRGGVRRLRRARARGDAAARDLPAARRAASRALAAQAVDAPAARAPGVVPAPRRPGASSTSRSAWWA